MMLGIDTGGTYTDGVLFDEEQAVVVGQAKARTRSDLRTGIGEVLTELIDDPGAVSMVALSTTLATNAIVEGVGGRVALIFIGFDERDAAQAGLARALGGDPLIMAAGGHDPFGNPVADLDLAEIVQQIDSVDVDAVAVTSKFSVRNPEHEIAVRELMETRGLPVTCGHELTARLNGPKRALTCVLNARLLGLIRHLGDATRSMLSERGIDAPLMLVRGDGSLVSEAFAHRRPIETILSGPAASLIAAGFLTGETDAVIADIGGTTTDIGILIDGKPSISLEGAIVGGYQTMVEAVEMHTHGLGGDSEVTIDDRGGAARVVLGPRRVSPICVLAAEEPDLVHRTLDSWTYPVRRHDVRFLAATGRPGAVSAREQTLLDRMGEGWRRASDVIKSNVESHTARHLVARGLAAFSGFTPTDAAHALGLQAGWDTGAALKAAGVLAHADNGQGRPISEDGLAFAQFVIDSLTRRSSEVLLDAALSHDGLGSTSSSPLVQVALDGHQGVARVDVGLDLPVVGLGASAATYYPAVAGGAGARAIIPEHAAVANAIGAVVGRVRITRRAVISQPSKGKFRVHLTGADRDFGDKDPAVEYATHALIGLAEHDAAEAGAQDVITTTHFAERSAVVGQKKVFVEGTVTVVSSGRPRLAGR